MAPFFTQILKLRSVKLPKGPQKRVHFLIPPRPSPEEKKHCTIPHCPFLFLKLVVSQKGSTDIDLTHVVLQRSTAQ